MDHEYLEPAASIIEKLGGLDAAAEAGRVHKSRASRWRMPQSKGGTGGLIPSKRQPLLLAWAREKGKPLQAEDFFCAAGDDQAA
jgi:hypothetical protein